MGVPINPTEIFPTAYYSERLTEDEKRRLEVIRKINTDVFVEEYCKAHSMEHLLRKNTEQIKEELEKVRAQPELSYVNDEFGDYCLPTRFLRWLSIKLFFADLLDFFPRCLEAIWR
jgi:hypothetical protein